MGKLIENKFEDIYDFISNNQNADLPQLNINILRNITLEPFYELYIKYYALKAGYNVNIEYGDYDNILKNTLEINEKPNDKSADILLVFAYLDNLSPKLAKEAISSIDEIKKEEKFVMDFVSRVLEGMRAKSDAVIIWHSFLLPVHPIWGISESQLGNYNTEVIRGLNHQLIKQLKETGNAYIADLNLCLARLGEKEFYDMRYWHVAKSPFSKNALKEIAFEDFKIVRALKGKNKKCLVLDCDDVLWGGIVGEDGLDGIQLGRTYGGSEYYEFQQEVLNLHKKGVILAINSKNNENDVREVFQKHPYMLLKEEHISTFYVNWNDKASNLIKIAEELNLGLDSIVFVDDSIMEIELIKKALPMVETIYLDKSKPYMYRNLLAACGLFDSLSFTYEDSKRGLLYKQESERKKVIKNYAVLSDCYRTMEMVLKINRADDFTVSRISQLTQKTNQFNLTNKRYTVDDIKSFSISQQYDVLYAELEDRFGNMGIIGTCILKYEDNTAIIDNLLISCRALGRGVEDVLLSYSVKCALEKNKEKIAGEYVPNGRNQQAEEFYPKRGFIQEYRDNKTIFICDPNSFKNIMPDYYKLIKSTL